MRFDIEQALTRDEALEAIASRWSIERRVEFANVKDAIGRVLAQDCRARYDLPRHRVSAMDGIAVRSADFANGAPDTSRWRRGVDFVQADTGDDFPDAFDAVIAIENVTFDSQDHPLLPGDLVVEPGRSVKPAGATMREGELLGAEGEKITPRGAALLAAGGWTQLPVVAPLRVAFIPTGTELVPVGQEPERGENVETNSLMVGAMLEEWGASVEVFDIVIDDRAKLSASLDKALSTADVVLINGGSSCGSEDFNSFLLKERASYFSHGIKAVPGRPIGLAVIDGKPALNVPGPMIAALLACDWLLRGLVCRYYGTAAPARQKARVVLDAPLAGRPGFEYLARLVTREVDGELHAAPVANGSTLAQNVRAVDAFAAVPAGVRHEAGDEIEVELLDTVVRA